MSNGISHQKNASQNYNEISLHTHGMAKIKKMDNNMLTRMWRNWSSHTLLDCKMVQPLNKTVWQFLQTLNIELPDDPAILLLDVHPKEMKTYVYSKICVQTFMQHCLLLQTKWQKQPKYPSTDCWINKMFDIHTKILLGN